MKKVLLSLAAVTLLTVALSACSGTLRFFVDVDTNLPPGVTVSNATYQTSYEADVKGQRQYVICNDRTTKLTYSFNYTGNLDTWSSYLRGAASGTVPADSRATFSASDYARDGYVEVTYTIPAGLSPTAIVPTPKVKGYTQLVVQLDGFGSDQYAITYNDIPVLEVCP